MRNEVIRYSKEINSRIIIIDNDNKVKVDSREEFIGDTFKHEEVQKALKGNSAANIYNYKEYGRLMYTSVPIILNSKIIGAALISTSIDNIYSRVEDIENALYIISFISTLFIALISFILANIFSKPIKKFTNAIMNMAKGNLNQRVDIDTNDEFSQLASAFNIMSTKLDQVDIQRKDFVANVSHELRTPLSSIKLLSESLLHQDNAGVEIYREFLTDIDSEIDRLNNIIDDLLTLVDLDKERLNLNYKVTYVNYLLEKIITRLKPIADKKNISISYKAEEKLQINLDKDKIQQSIINIVHNAIKYTPNGGNVEVKLHSDGKNVVIEISDDGIGIPNKDLEHIFERFYRVDKARTRNTGGTGLGLSIAYQIVTLHQGKIEVESEVDKGTTFYIKLPIDTNMV
ncbi:HAMP domain-containing protein [Clostridium sp. D2Q-11]|uniref:histidine kinase n=2 Tax=Anaeromonas frigoriresistens TaxID=2683708 RepID=A0A942URB6_9FIRM|nr:HAMP domain-containing protein [Anaeromonas frigoriresistens]